MQCVPSGGQDIKRDLPTIVELGAGPGFLRHYLDPEGSGTKKIIMCDSSREALYRDEHLDKDGKCECYLFVCRCAF